MRRRCASVQVQVLRHLAVPIAVLLLASGGALAQSGDNHAQDQHGKPPPPRRRQGQPAQDRRIRRGCAGHQRPRRQSRMRLARPPCRPPDVARRPRYRLPPPRSLRPLRLPRRPYPGGVPLPDPLRQPDRSQGGRNASTAGCTPAGSIRAPSRRPRPPPPAGARRTAGAAAPAPPLAAAGTAAAPSPAAK